MPLARPWRRRIRWPQPHPLRPRARRRGSAGRRRRGRRPGGRQGGDHPAAAGEEAGPQEEGGGAGGGGQEDADAQEVRPRGRAPVQGEEDGREVLRARPARHARQEVPRYSPGEEALAFTPGRVRRAPDLLFFRGFPLGYCLLCY